MSEKKNLDLQEKHLFSSDDKLKWWGYGEWIEEPDFIEFIYKDYECMVVRTALKKHCEEFHMFGGHLCGYVKIHESHPYYKTPADDMQIFCHGGLTFKLKPWVGFDCAHSHDYIPSIEHLKKINPVLSDIIKAFPIPEDCKDSPIFTNTYRNVSYCVEECKNIVNQLIEIEKGMKNESR